MRNPTKEEIESTDAYINSISEIMTPLSELQEIRQEIITINPQISRETETDSGEMSATAMKNICVQIIDTHISALNK